MTSRVCLDPHDGSTHVCGEDLTSLDLTYPSAAEGGWDSCREAEWLALCEDVDATAEADELKYPSASSQ
jgi:hypothetical protein